MGGGGIEPPTRGFSVRCSANWGTQPRLPPILRPVVGFPLCRNVVVGQPRRLSGLAYKKFFELRQCHAIRFEVISVMEDDAFPGQMAPSGGANRQGNEMKLAI